MESANGKYFILEYLKRMPAALLIHILLTFIILIS